MKKKYNINWTNLLFLTITPIIGVMGTIYIILHNLLCWPTITLTIVMTIATGLAVTAGYHRLFAHRSYQTNKLVRFIFLLFAAATFEGSVLEWCTDHRRHHRYTDTDQDPYNIKQGFWHAHIGWLVTLDPSKRNFDNVEDLAKDPLIQFQHRYFPLLAIIMGILLPTAIAALWHDMLGGFVISAALRITLNHHFTFCINSVCHLFGKRTYSDQQSARDNWFTALFTYGEGFHNFHHQFPIDYRNGIRAYHFDPSKWLIYFLAKIKQAYHLQRVSNETIIRYRIHNEEKRILELSKQKIGPGVLESTIEKIQTIRKNIIDVLNYIEKLEKDYIQLKKENLNGVSHKVAKYYEQLKEHRQQLKIARYNLKRSLLAWAQMTRNYQLS